MFIVTSIHGIFRKTRVMFIVTYIQGFSRSNVYCDIYPGIQS
jgi:hypothetical protein